MLLVKNSARDNICGGFEGLNYGRIVNLQGGVQRIVVSPSLFWVLGSNWTLLLKQGPTNANVLPILDTVFRAMIDRSRIAS